MALPERVATDERLTPVDMLLLRAGVYYLLALGYAYPERRQRGRIRDLSADLAAWVAHVHPEWPDRLNRLRGSLESATVEETEAEFNRLFSGAMDAAPHETAYEPDIFRKQHALADIAGFYRAFGFQTAAGSRWQPDHVGVELEYCSILLQRTAHALEEGWEEQAAVSADALRTFLLEHLGRWSAAFAADLSKVARSPFYRDLAGATRDWVEVELAAMGLEPDRLRSRQVYADDLSLPVCGGCTGCGPEPGPPACPLAPNGS